MSYYVWVGPRESDCIFSKIFSDTICYHSDKHPLSFRHTHIYGANYNQIVADQMNLILKEHPDAAFVFYNPKIAYRLPKELRAFVVCLNKQYLLEFLSDKIHTRYWLSNYVPILPSSLLESQNLSFQTFREMICPAEQYVVQQNKSSGGFGTYFIEDNSPALKHLKENTKEVYIVSPYMKNSISVNVHAIISEQSEALFKPSLQIVQNDGNQLLYHGADFIALKKLPQKLIDKINKHSVTIVSKLRSLGFLGILGIDYIVTEDEVYFLEINPRFQASSILIDKMLKEQTYPSLAEMNLSAFASLKDTLNIPPVHELDIPYSFYKYFYHENSRHLNYVYHKASTNPYIEDIFTDGWYPEMPAEPYAYCYSLIFNTHITSLNPDASFNIYSNISGEEAFIGRASTDNIMAFKISLLNQGCTLSENALRVLQQQGSVKQAVFHAIDFYCFHQIPVNSPVNLKFTDFSPFRICSDNSGRLQLCYYENVISDIRVELKPDWTQLSTSSGIPYERLAYLSTDRLRIKHEGVCFFKLQDQGCYFCNIPKSNLNIQNSDLAEVIQTLVQTPSFRHILIGGGSGCPETEYKQILFIAEKIREVNSQIPIYLMSLPPTDMQILDLYQQAGINEVAFNIEIMDRNSAKNFMPGKGAIPLEKYLDTLEYSTTLWGRTGNVRTALIVGLNSTDTLLNGMEMLCQKGIQPMLSIFRPLPNTKLEWMVPPSNQYLMNIYKQAEELCHSYGLALGPSCDACKNNMLAV